MVYGDGKGSGAAEIQIADNEINPASFLDGFTAVVSVDQIGWRN